MRRPLTLKGDVALFADRWGVTESAAVAALEAVARGRGGLRDACDAGYLLDAAARVFGLLRSGLALGVLSLDDEAAILGLAALAERALDHAARAEGDELARLSVALDAAMGGPGDDAPEAREDAP